MRPECAHTYPGGRPCRRIPKTGEKFCPGHQPRPRRRADHDDQAFVDEMHAWVDRLHATPLELLLVLLQDSLADIQPLIESKSSRAHRVAFTRATIAVTASIDRLEESMAGYRAYLSRSATSAPSLHPPSPHLMHPPTPQPAQASASGDPLITLDHLDALCEKLLRALPSHAEPQLP